MNRGEIRDDGFFTKVKHYEEGSAEPVQLSEVREDTGISVDVAEPPAQKGELWLTQGAQETVLSQNRTFIFLLNLDVKQMI